LDRGVRRRARGAHGGARRHDFQLSRRAQPVEYWRKRMTPEDRHRHLKHAQSLFNTRDYWLAHEALETLWRSIIKERPDEARVWQGLIQAAAALLHAQKS